VPDGSSEARAAASCWEVKQVTPSAPDGVYWLWTPDLVAPERFYCDQTTDGGGWVLIGRGRENWSTSNEGVGTAADVRSVTTGTAAFAPRQLPVRTVDALLNGKPVSSLTDGIRLRRATDQAGSGFQEVRFTLSSPRDHWTWLFNNEQRVARWTIGSATGTGGTTSNLGTGSEANRIDTRVSAAIGWSPGFSYGSSVKGSTSSSSYLWASSSTAGYARPFTQAYLRPKVLTSDLASPLSDTADEHRGELSNQESFALPTVYGAYGLGAGPKTLEGSVEVSAFAESQGVVYVGGNFTSVQKSASGSSAVAQKYLAAFNAKTGALIDTFRPTFNNQIKALAALPDGRIAVGGYFTTANGAPAAGLTVLDPTTGATSAGFTGRLINYVGNTSAVVRSLDVQGSWLYVGGSFTHATGGTESTEVYSRSAIRLAVTDGTPDRAWHPTFNGTVVSLDASAQNDRVYFAGYFTSTNGTTTEKAAALSASDATVTPWTVKFTSASSNYQQAVKEIGNRVWLGGSQHMLYSYDRSTMAELSSNITASGGDFQTISTDGTTLYAGCHCFYTNYSGTHSWPNPGTGWTSADKINSLGAWSATTGAYLPSFSPTVSSPSSGAWASMVDSNGVLWMGGDFTASTKTGDVRQWSSGFVRYPTRDQSAPTTPTGVDAETVADVTTVSWSASTDNRGSVRYQVIQDGRIVTTTSETDVELPAVADGTEFVIRSFDTALNLSARSGIVTAESPQEPEPGPTTLVAKGSTWNYYFETAAPPATWSDATFDSSTWRSGAAAVGWGSSSLATTITTTASPKPSSLYFRTDFTLPAAVPANGLTLTTRADDGIVVFVNGVEVGRSNVISGTIGHNTYANSAPNTATATANPVTITVPASALVPGRNVIAAHVVTNYRSSPSASFELEAVTR
jgi:hypothetical protein